MLLHPQAPVQPPAAASRNQGLLNPRVPCGEEPWISGERQQSLPVRCQRLLSSLCRAQGPEPGDSQPFPPPGPMERDHGAFSLMQCYEYSGSFCSLFNGFECEKVVELGRGEREGGGQASLLGDAAPALDLFSIWRALGSFSPPQPCKGSLPFLPHAY